MEEPDSDPYLCTAGILLNMPVDISTGIVIGFIVLVLLFVVSALISGSEIAFFSLGPAQMNRIRSDESPAGRLILRLLEKPKRLLATILITNNFINVSIVILAAYLLREFIQLAQYPLLGFLLEVVVITALILLFGEIMPKIYATQKADTFAAFMAKPLQILVRILYPLSQVLVRSTSVIDKRLARKNQNISMSDLSEAIEITADETTAEEDTKILKGIVKFGDIEVSEIMKSRMDITAVDAGTEFDELVKIVTNSGYSRIPVYRESLDNIIGLLYVKDLLPYLNGKEEFSWVKLVHQAFFVPENKKISDLLQEFQEKKIHLAVVVDEYGGTSGIVTLEDILEEIVGEISDEYDMPGDDVDYKKLNDKNYIFEGKTSINDFCKIVNIDDRIFETVKGDSDTLAGLILEIQGEIPPIDTVVTFGDFDFRIISADTRRIQKIKVTLKD